jgi:hypothetical protein
MGSGSSEHDGAKVHEASGDASLLGVARQRKPEKQQVAWQGQEGASKREDACSYTTFSGSSPPAEATQFQDGKGAASQRVCSTCGKQKDLSAFSPKGASRYHSRCKACNNDARKTSYRERNGRSIAGTPAGAGVRPWAAPVEVFVKESNHADQYSVADRPTPASQPDETHIEPSEEADFSIWKKLYNRALTEVEKIEIKTNLMAFFTLLKEEARRQSR